MMTLLHKQVFVSWLWFLLQLWLCRALWDFARQGSYCKPQNPAVKKGGFTAGSSAEAPDNAWITWTSLNCPKTQFSTSNQESGSKGAQEPKQSSKFKMHQTFAFFLNSPYLQISSYFAARTTCFGLTQSRSSSRLVLEWDEMRCGGRCSKCKFQDSRSISHENARLVNIPPPSDPLVLNPPQGEQVKPELHRLQQPSIKPKVQGVKCLPQNQSSFQK